MYKYVLLLVFASLNAFAIDDTLRIKTYEKNSFQTITNTTKIVAIDSLTKISLQFGNLASALAQSANVIIKSYSPGLLSTISLRGGNAQQTNILWHGLNIQNNNLGQVDLSTIPFGFFNETYIDYGAKASSGQAATSGAIVLGDEKIIKNSIAFGTSYNTINNSSSLLKLNFKKAKFSSRFNFSHQKNANEFYFIDEVNYKNELQKMRNATQNNFAFLQENTIKINAKSKIETGIWLNSQKRNIPSQLPLQIYNPQQTDKSFKAIIANANTYKNALLNLRIAYMADSLNYVDIQSKINGRNFWSGAVFETDFSYKKYEKHLLKTNYHFSIFKGKSNSYNVANQSQQRQNISVSDAYTINSKNILIADVTLMQVNNKAIYPQGKINYLRIIALKNNLVSSINTSIYNAFRYPTLNDLFWNPGGNINLKPEKSVCAETNFQLKWKALESNFSFFEKHVNNWIIWLPTGTLWSPQNAAYVVCKGFETTIAYTIKRNYFSIKLKLAYTNTSAINAKISENKGKQLIYVPLHNASANLTLTYKKLFANFTNQYTGYRYTSANNVDYLNPNTVSNLMLGYHFTIKKIVTQLTFSCFNIFNTNYQSIAYRPMPLRYSELAINFKF